MTDAEWRPISINYTAGGMSTIYGVTLHIMAGTLTGTDSWFRNPRAQASSHFGTGRQGALLQWVDTRDKAWAQAGGNPNWISIENEGNGGDTLTDTQLDRCAEVLAWAHKTHGVPLQIATSPSGRGLGHHAMGGQAWGGHLACPGSRVIAQKREIINRAKRLVVGTPSKVDDAPLSWPGRLLKYVKSQPMMSGRDVRVWQAALTTNGFATDVDGAFGPQTAERTRAFQRKNGLAIDGIVGPQTWAAGVRAARPKESKPAPEPEPEEDTIKIVLVDGVPQWPGRTLRVTSPMMRGADVRLWQEKLAKRGWNIGVDGIYGPRSLAVCRGYQRATGLKATGQVDRATWDMTWSWRPPAAEQSEPDPASAT
ncbi:peptidoglycan recognition protein family protein [Microtetraspora malaysiensis]|uniref:N-acetylmuramoyl-L-alanine amidase n=1 Tax=Microtetraspora malaysiensis TaxID=161358 RepID=A0ABW6T314_9ACTN